VSYEELLELVLTSHDPTRAAFKEQYASLVLARDKAQLAAARAVASRFEEGLARKLATRVELLKRFYPAEDYHQKYYLRNDRIVMADFRGMFGDDETAFRESAAAARANGYVAGGGARTQLGREIELLGLSEKGAAQLTARVC
jgi:peptide-methionine (S)-S-oxide reductase